ncbi:MAG: SDR family oxidoreductase [Actinobacteria bacterium]|nr:SDR family oxidoreductase [Actinomycetota bacterium]
MTSTPETAAKTFAPGLFRGRTVLVTGGGRGIGRATALGFATLGASVAIAARNADNLEKTLRDLHESGVPATSFVTDIRNTGSVEALRDHVLGAFGRLDFLVNNAGGQFPARPSQISDRGFRAVVDLNLHGTWNMMSRFVPDLVEAGDGSVVNIVHNQVGDRGAPLFIHSGAARAGVVNLTRTAALYLAHRGVTVNALAPGPVDTQGFREEEVANISPDVVAYTQRIINDTPIRRLQSPEETAAHIIFLCSPAARSITGQLIVADAGNAMGNQNAVYDPSVDW